MLVAMPVRHRITCRNVIAAYTGLRRSDESIDNSDLQCSTKRIVTQPSRNSAGRAGQCMNEPDRVVRRSMLLPGNAQFMVIERELMVGCGEGLRLHLISSASPYCSSSTRVLQPLDHLVQYV